MNKETKTAYANFFFKKNIFISKLKDFIFYKYIRQICRMNGFQKELLTYLLTYSFTVIDLQTNRLTDKMKSDTSYCV